MNNNDAIIKASGGRVARSTVVYLMCMGLTLVTLAACGQTSPATAPPTANEAAVEDSPAQPAQPAPTTAEGYFEQGNELVKQGQLEVAVEAYQKAVELDPDYQAVYANLGVVYYQLEQLDLAAQQYEKALDLNPEDGEVIYNLGALNLQRALTSSDTPDPDLLAQAVAQLEQALEFSPTLAEPYFSLGVAYFAQDDQAQARVAFQTFLEKDSGNDPRASQEAHRYLDTLDSNN